MIKNRFNLNYYKSYKSKKTNKLNKYSNITNSYRMYSSKNKISNIKSENERWFSNSFSNLKMIKEKSFQLNSSYENLNKITNNRYIKNNSLQLKIKNILMNEYSVAGNDSSNIGYILTKDPLNGQFIISRDKNIKNLTKDFDIEQDKRSFNSLDLSKLNSNRSNKSNDTIATFRKENLLESEKNESNKIICDKQININNSNYHRFKSKSPRKKEK